jgi:hypothetical protein
MATSLRFSGFINLFWIALMKRRPVCPLSLSRRLVLSVIASLAVLGHLPAQALGRLTDVEVIDRDSGEVLPVIRHKGEYWIAGRAGARYAVSLQNRQHARVLSVVSVDGVNVISGETAALHQTGYVLAPRQAYRITGWRKSDQEVASFQFTAAPASYAERTGRPDHLGVIGVALFREKEAPPPVSVTPTFPHFLAALLLPIAPNISLQRVGPHSQASRLPHGQSRRSGCPRPDRPWRGAFLRWRSQYGA